MQLALKEVCLWIFQVAQIKSNVVICVNLLDEAEKKGVCINTDVMEKIFDLPVIPMKARKGIGINELKEAVYISDKKEILQLPYNSRRSVYAEC